MSASPGLPASASSWKRQEGPPLGLQLGRSPASPGCWASDPQDWETRRLCCSRPPPRRLTHSVKVTFLPGKGPICFRFNQYISVGMYFFLVRPLKGKGNIGVFKRARQSAAARGPLAGPPPQSPPSGPLRPEPRVSVPQLHLGRGLWHSASSRVPNKGSLTRLSKNGQFCPDGHFSF